MKAHRSILACYRVRSNVVARTDLHHLLLPFVSSSALKSGYRVFQSATHLLRRFSEVHRDAQSIWTAAERTIPPSSLPVPRVVPDLFRVHGTVGCAGPCRPVVMLLTLHDQVTLGIVSVVKTSPILPKVILYPFDSSHSLCSNFHYQHGRARYRRRGSLCRFVSVFVKTCSSRSPANTGDHQRR